MRQIWTDIATAVLVVALIVLFLLTAIPAHYVESQGGDYPYYVTMAQVPLDNHVPSPWRFRLLNPLLASTLIAAGFSASASFLLLTALFAAASLVLMRIYLEQLGTSRFTARAGALLFAASVGAYIPLRRYYGYTDALTNFFILLVLILAATRRYRVLAAVLGTGTLAKESLLLLLPFLARRISVAARSWRVAASVLSVPIAVFLLLRLVVGPGPSGTAPVALSLDAQFEYWQTAMVHGPVRWILWALAYSMGPVWLLAALAVRRNISFVATMLLVSVLALVPLLRTTDTERALMLLFPIVFPLAAHSLDECRHHRGARWSAAVAVTCTFLAQLTFDWVPQARLGPVNAKDAAFLLLCILPVVATRWCRSGCEPVPLTWPANVNR